MKILILGGDGYLGWPTAMYLARKHDVTIVDSYSKRSWENEVNISPLLPIPTMSRRCGLFKGIKSHIANLLLESQVNEMLHMFQPDVIIHYAEQPSAPYSMRDTEKAVKTQHNNVIGTLNLIWGMRFICPEAHLIKLGTMGEYGTPDCDIPEGNISKECYLQNLWADPPDCPMAGLPFPKSPGSFYHLSKVHDSNNLMLASKLWGLKVTDLNQGVVYGINTPETKEGLHTSFHYDEVFGTVINRFCAQAVAGIPLTVYGQGGQKRGFININDTLKCVELALENPGEGFRVFNQFTEISTVNGLAVLVRTAAKEFGLDVTINLMDNPREEAELHHYNPSNESLMNLGLNPIKLVEVLPDMIETLLKHKDKINESYIYRGVKWK